MSTIPLRTYFFDLDYRDSCQNIQPYCPRNQYFENQMNYDNYIIHNHVLNNSRVDTLSNLFLTATGIIMSKLMKRASCCVEMYTTKLWRSFTFN